MFAASKIFSFAIEPLFWALAFLLAGLLVMGRRPRLGKGLAWAALAAIVLGSWVALPVALLRQLESRYPVIPDGTDLRPYAGVVVLGGSLANSKLWITHRQVALNEHAERLTMAVSLARKNPHLKLLFTGGISSLPSTGLPEAWLAKKFFDDMGVNPSQVLYEGMSRNTAENATLSAVVPGVDKSQRWLLLTSGFHMPRAMAAFERVGWNVTPYPVDFRIASKPRWWDFSLHNGPGAWSMALHELVGLVVYRLAEPRTRQGP